MDEYKREKIEDIFFTLFVAFGVLIALTLLGIIYAIDKGYIKIDDTTHGKPVPVLKEVYEEN